jgi:hypothetical protein
MTQANNVEAVAFSSFSDPVIARFKEISQGELFVVKADDIFERYLAAFPAGSDPIFRTRTEHDCQCCKQFIRRIGVVVAIRDGKTLTIWGGHDLPEPYQTVADALDAYVGSLPIESVFRTKERKYGLSHNYDGKTNQRYDHFAGEVDSKHWTADAGTKIGEQNAIFQVLKRGLTEIRPDDIDAVLDLIATNALYRGEEHKWMVEGFKSLLREYRASGSSELFIWANLGNRNARFRNTVIGTLLTDLAEGKEIEEAVKAFEVKVAPTNYKRTTSIITQRMVEDAVQKLNDLGLSGAINRRYARISDVSVNDVLFVDNDSRSKMKDGIFVLLESGVKKSKPSTKDATAIAADAFVSEVLPTAKTLEVLVENRHVGNFVSLTGSDGQERLFKWNNNFAWSYDGDVTDSVKQRVKAAGGNIYADLRVSLSWFNLDDLDLHAMPPRGSEIYYVNKQGILDVDMNAHAGHTRTPVENMAFIKPGDGLYRFWVHQFRRREATDVGFAIEFECRGVLQRFSYATAMRDSQSVPCFSLHVKNGGIEKVETSLKGGTFSQEKWGIKTETLVPVTAVMYSPNHWGDQKVGAKHLIFSLRDCNNPEPTRGIYNEFLRSDLEAHRKVFEVLGAKSKCKPSADQVSGVGFTAARGDSVTVVVDGRRSYNLSF